MVRTGSPVRFRRGAPHQTSSSGRVRCPACCMPRELRTAVCQKFARNAVRSRQNTHVAPGLAGPPRAAQQRRRQPLGEPGSPRPPGWPLQGWCGGSGRPWCCRGTGRRGCWPHGPSAHRSLGPGCRRPPARSQRSAGSHVRRGDRQRPGADRREGRVVTSAEPALAHPQQPGHTRQAHRGRSGWWWVGWPGPGRRARPRARRPSSSTSSPEASSTSRSSSRDLAGSKRSAMAVIVAHPRGRSGGRAA
jgi:hypothetical protein